MRPLVAVTVTVNSTGGVVGNVTINSSMSVEVPGSRNTFAEVRKKATGPDFRRGETDIERLNPPKNPSLLSRLTEPSRSEFFWSVGQQNAEEMPKSPGRPVLPCTVSGTMFAPLTTVTQKSGETLVMEQPVWKSTSTADELWVAL